MLVLSRQKNERVVIGDMEITITIVDIRGDKVRLGITAPTEIAVHRKEVYEAIQRERAAQERLVDLSLPPGKSSSPSQGSPGVSAKPGVQSSSVAPGLPKGTEATGQPRPRAKPAGG